MIRSKLWRGILGYVQEIRGFNRNVRLLLLASVLGSMSFGIFSVEFNLYILSLGIHVDVLGKIPSAGPFAHALGAIPIGFLSKVIGYKRVFVLIFGLWTKLHRHMQGLTGDKILYMGSNETDPEAKTRAQGLSPYIYRFSSARPIYVGSG